MNSLLTNPIRTRYQFAPGGDRIPIQTRASGLPVAGYSTQGLPTNNRTTLGAYRMGDTDGISAPSAIYPGDIFAPIPARDRRYPQITFENVGNRVYQPEDDTHKLHALLKALGDQKFKYDTNAPFADYFATQRLAREADEASRNAGVEDLGHSREILRNLVDTRRKQSNDDYLRKLLDAGMTLEDAEDELEGVRRANALQEAKRVEDRSYQSKLLLSRIAKSRGITPNIQEPLTSSSAIEDPQRSQALASALGEPGTGFGTAPLDNARQFLTPEFYRRFLRRTGLTQESADQQAAIANLIAEGGAGIGGVGKFQQYVDEEGITRTKNIGDITASAYSAATLSGASRENAIENIREQYASRLQNLRRKKVLLPLAPILFGESVLQRIYTARDKEPGEQARFSYEVFEDLPNFQKIVAINQLISSDKTGDRITRLREFLRPKVLVKRTTRGDMPADNLADILTQAGNSLLGSENTVRIPFVGETISISLEQIQRVLEEFKGIDRTELDNFRREARDYAAELEEVDLGGIVPEGELNFVPFGEEVTGDQSAVPILTGEPAPRSNIFANIARSEPGRLRGPLLGKLNKDGLTEIAEKLGISTEGTNKQIAARIAATNRYTGSSTYTDVEEVD